MASTSQDLMAWENETDGSRTPIWCKFCKLEGKPWIKAPLCGHIAIAKSEGKLDQETVKNTLRQLMSESPTIRPVDAS
jgi:hypothetical protein